ncbi:MAG: mechanosensitive ion channel family protein, partial [Planctomycetota bacterium]
LTEAVAEAPTSELTILLAPLSAEELAALTDSAMTRLRAVADELVVALIEQQRIHADADAGDADRDAIDARVDELVARKSTLVARVDVVLEALQAKGGDVASARSYAGVIRTLAPQVSTGRDTGEELSEEQLEQARLDKAVNAAIATIRDEPPVHERPEPWTVPVSEMELEMQPLRLAQVEERVKKWLEILQREVRERIRIDIALTRAEDGAERSELAIRSAEQQEIVQAVVRHIQAALLILQKRGGDITEYKNYIATATGQKLNLTDPGVLYAQALAWLKSQDGGVKLGLNVLKGIAILVAFWLLARILGRIVATGVGRLPQASTLLRKFLVGGVRKVTMVIGLVISVSALGVNITPLVAAIGAAGLVIGLALQGTLSNFASGILILIYRPYDVGDVINGGGVMGKVESMNLVSTSILTPDNQVLIVPNNSIWNGVVTNVTGRNTRRVDLVFGIGYGDDIAKATAILEEEMSQHEKVLKDPEPIVRVHELGDNSVNLIARPWTRTSDYWDVYWDLMRSVKERFDAAGVNIPFPQRDLHIPGPIEVTLANGDRGRRAAAGHGLVVETASSRQSAVAEPAPAGDGDGDGDDEA